MKRYCLILTMLLIALTGFSKDWYVVNSSSSLNIWAAPNVESKVIGSVNPNDTLDVYESANGWAKIIVGKSLGYVKSDALEYVGPARTKNKGNSEVENGDLGTEIFFLTWLITAIAMLVFILVKIKREHLTGFAHYLRWGIFLFVSLMELIIFPSLGWGIFDVFDGRGAEFALFLLFIPMTIMACLMAKTFYDIMDDVKHDYKVSFSFIWAPIALMAGFAITTISALWDNQITTISLFCITVLSQVYFIGNMIIKITKAKNIIAALVVLATYIIGTLALAPLLAFVLFSFLMIKLCKHFFGAAMTPTPDPYKYC